MDDEKGKKPKKVRLDKDAIKDIKYAVSYVKMLCEKRAPEMEKLQNEIAMLNAKKHLFRIETLRNLEELTEDHKGELEALERSLLEATKAFGEYVTESKIAKDIFRAGRILQILKEEACEQADVPVSAVNWDTYEVDESLLQGAKRFHELLESR